MFLYGDVNVEYVSVRYSATYLGFTSLVNYLYENNNSVNSNILKLSYKTLRDFRSLRDLFINQAMGKINLID